MFTPVQFLFKSLESGKSQLQFCIIADETLLCFGLLLLIPVNKKSFFLFLLLLLLLFFFVFFFCFFFNFTNELMGAEFQIRLDIEDNSNIIFLISQRKHML